MCGEITMSWENIVKRRLDQWQALSDVILGEYDYERWKDKKVPRELKELGEGYQKLSGTAKQAVDELMSKGFNADDRRRSIMFTAIRAIIRHEDSK